MAWLLSRQQIVRYTPFDLNQPENHDNSNYIAFRRGEMLDIPTPYVEFARQQKQTSSSIPDILTIRVFHFCSERFRLFVESWEPGLHLFRPVDMLRKNGDSIGQYYIWTVGQDIDCLFTDNLSEAWLHGEFRFGRVRTLAAREYEEPGKGKGVVIRVSKPAVEGRHLWTAGLLGADGEGGTSYFMSDEMYAAYKKQKFQSMKLCCPVEEVDRPWRAEDNMGEELDSWRRREDNIVKCWPDAGRRHGGGE